MPIPDLETIPTPDGAALQEAFWDGKDRFRSAVRKVLARPWAVDDPVPLLRFLQLVARPVWAVETRPEAGDYRAVMAGILPALTAARATVILHPPHEAPPGSVPGAAPGTKDAHHLLRLTWHGNRKVPGGWNYKASPVPGRFHFDRWGYSGWSEMTALTRAEVMAVPAGVAESHRTATILPRLASGASKFKQDATVPVEGEGFVFLPLQLINDSVIAHKHYPDSYIGGMRRIVASLVAAGMDVVVKRHPQCREALVERFLESLPAGARTSSASIHALIPRARAVLTLNSGVGFEALMHGRPVIVAGKAEYGPAAVELTDPDGAAAAVEAAVAGFDPAFAARFVFLALEMYAMDPKDERSVGRALLRAACGAVMEPGPR